MVIMPLNTAPTTKAFRRTVQRLVSGGGNSTAALLVRGKFLSVFDKVLLHSQSLNRLNDTLGAGPHGHPLIARQEEQLC